MVAGHSGGKEATFFLSLSRDVSKKAAPCLVKCLALGQDVCVAGAVVAYDVPRCAWIWCRTLGTHRCAFINGFAPNRGDGGACWPNIQAGTARSIRRPHHSIWQQYPQVPAQDTTQVDTKYPTCYTLERDTTGKHKNARGDVGHAIHKEAWRV